MTIRRLIIVAVVTVLFIVAISKHFTVNKRAEMRQMGRPALKQIDFNKFK